MKTINLYRNTVSVRRVLCSKKGYVEYIEKEVPHFGTSRFYALFTQNRVLIGTCGYQSGVDRFEQFSDMRDFLLSDRSTFDEKTGAITEPLAW